MSLAALVRRMTEAGAPPEAIAIALEELERIQAKIDERKASEATRTRRYRERGGGNIPAELRREVFDRDNWTCQECGSQDYLQCDHVHPVSRGGQTTFDNLQALCRTCNARKKDRIRKQDVRGNVHGHSTDIEQTSEDVRVRVPPKETPPDPLKKSPPPVCETRARGKRPLPKAWQPSPLKPDGQAGLIVARKPVGWIERELSKFKDHALQNNRQCSDWDAAWRNWIKQTDELDGRRTNGMGRHQPPNDGLSSTARAALQVFGTD